MNSTAIYDKLNLFQIRKILKIIITVLTVACSPTNESENPTGSKSTEYKMIDYSELENLDIQLPYTYQFSHKDKAVFVYGSYHTSNPEDSIIEDIESKINSFNPDLVLYEGDGISFESTREESVEYYFEMGLVRYLCNESKIPNKNLEPKAKFKYQDLLQRHVKSEVFLATIGSQITLMLISKKDIEFETFYSQFIRDLEKEGYPITEDEKDISYFLKNYKDFYGIPFDLNTFDYETVEIKFNKTKLNKINQESARFRDIYMLNLIENELLKYDRIYIQVGGRHAIVWESAINEIVKKQQNDRSKNTY